VGCGIPYRIELKTPIKNPVLILLLAHSIMKPFHFRVHFKTPEDFDKCMAFIREQNSLDTLVVNEVAAITKKLHFHSIFSTDTILSTLRQQFHRAMLPSVYDGKKNEYCIKQIPDIEIYDAEKYLCKGDSQVAQPNVYLQTGKYTVERVIELHADYWSNGGPRAPPVKTEDIRQYGETIITHRVEKIIKPKKNFYNDVVEYLHRQFPERVWNARDTPIMLNAIMKLHGKLFRPYGPQQIENEMNVIMNILVFDSHYADMYETLKARGNIPHL